MAWTDLINVLDAACMNTFGMVAEGDVDVHGDAVLKLRVE